jgi:hypothetical protein
MGNPIEIMFEDLVESKKREILKEIGIKKPEEMNWDIFPIAIIEVEMEDEK